MTTTSDLALVARAVGGDRVKVEFLARGVMNPHHVDARPSFMVKLMKADLFIQTGLDLEGPWAPLLVQGSRNRRIQPGFPGYLDASQAVKPIQVPENPTRAQGDVHPGGNPHYMSDPENVALVAGLVGRKLGELDPANAGEYEANAAAFAARARALLKVWLERLKPHRGAKYVSYHRDWSYFAERFGLVPAGEIEPQPGIPPTPGHTARLIERMKAERVRVILTDPWYERRTPEFVARETGAKVLDMALFPDAAGAEDLEAWMGRNVRLVAEALEGK